MVTITRRSTEYICFFSRIHNSSSAQSHQIVAFGSRIFCPVLRYIWTYIIGFHGTFKTNVLKVRKDMRPCPCAPVCDCGRRWKIDREIEYVRLSTRICLKWTYLCVWGSAEGRREMGVRHPFTDRCVLREIEVKPFCIKIRSIRVLRMGICQDENRVLNSRNLTPLWDVLFYLCKLRVVNKKSLKQFSELEN